MKIEIGESLLQSYLKNVKKCIVTQTNWRTASSWKIEDENLRKIESIYDRIQQHQDFSDVFKSSSLEQTIKQAELDVVGINNEKLYLVEVAFHERGLQYGERLETKDRVCKKLLRAYLIALLFFPNYKYEIMFASPKVNPATDKTIREYFTILNNDFSDKEKVLFSYIANEEFEKDILIPTIESTLSDSDSSELFLRSVKMLDLFNMLNLNAGKYDKHIARKIFAPKNTSSTNDGGDLIQSEIRKVKNRLPGWFSRPEQKNSKILYAYLSLYDSSVGYVLFRDLQQKANMGSVFKTNFDQMVNFGEKNHGKIFESEGERVYLWEKVKDYVLELYDSIRQNRTV